MTGWNQHITNHPFIISKSNGGQHLTVLIVDGRPLTAFDSLLENIDNCFSILKYIASQTVLHLAGIKISSAVQRPCSLLCAVAFGLSDQAADLV